MWLRAANDALIICALATIFGGLSTPFANTRAPHKHKTTHTHTHHTRESEGRGLLRLPDIKHQKTRRKKDLIDTILHQTPRDSSPSLDARLSVALSIIHQRTERHGVCVQYQWQTFSFFFFASNRRHSSDTRTHTKAVIHSSLGAGSVNISYNNH